jgi:DNA-binding transcriptional ArsR family regulator
MFNGERERTDLVVEGGAMILSPESVARFAAMLADRSRAAMCLALMDGRAWTAGELARHAGIAAPTASEHLTQLVQAGLLAEERQGRHRYLRLAGPDVARLIEDLAVAAGQPAPTRSLRAVRAAEDLAAARTCYDHLAGALGVWLFDAMVAGGLLATADGLAVTTAGRSWFIDLAGPDALRPSRSRPLVRSCLDWTERKPHLAGALGAVLQRQLVARSWVRPAQGTRAVRVTPEGELALGDLLGAELPGLSASQPTRSATA